MKQARTKFPPLPRQETDSVMMIVPHPRHAMNPVFLFLLATIAFLLDSVSATMTPEELQECFANIQSRLELVDQSPVSLAEASALFEGNTYIFERYCEVTEAAISNNAERRRLVNAIQQNKGDLDERAKVLKTNKNARKSTMRRKLPAYYKKDIVPHILSNLSSNGTVVYGRRIGLVHSRLSRTIGSQCLVLGSGFHRQCVQSIANRFRAT